MNLKEAFALAEILAPASQETLASLASCASLKRVKRGEHIFHERDAVKTLYIVVDGMAAIYKLGDGGERKVIFVYGAGKALNEAVLNGLPASESCEALRGATLLCFPVERMLAAMSSDFALSMAVMDSMSIKIRRLYRQIKNTVGSLRCDKKIAAKLWKLSRDYGVPSPEGTEIAFDLSVTYLADMLGAQRESVSRQLRLLAEEGLVLFRAGRFIIPDREALQSYFKSP
ncbi:MAG: Crp/Fnr family transcriptional regulator [Synergistaceae bacterium]|nr:Crp/Fnr family transcriptional regulator [Synergistaceae bacterium]